MSNEQFASSAMMTGVRSSIPFAPRRRLVDDCHHRLARTAGPRGYPGMEPGGTAIRTLRSTSPPAVTRASVTTSYIAHDTVTVSVTDARATHRRMVDLDACDVRDRVSLHAYN